MLMVTTICWPMLGVALEGVAADVALPLVRRGNWSTCQSSRH